MGPRTASAVWDIAKALERAAFDIGIDVDWNNPHGPREERESPPTPPST